MLQVIAGLDAETLETLLPAAGVVLLVSAHAYYHPAAQFGWLAWLAVFAVHFISLRRLAATVPAKVLSAAHVLGCWMLIGVLALELRYGLLLLSDQYNAWRWLGWAILPSLYLVLAAAPRNWPWPVATYPREYRVLAALPLAVLMLGWFWLANVFSELSRRPRPRSRCRHRRLHSLEPRASVSFCWSKTRPAVPWPYVACCSGWVIACSVLTRGKRP